MRRSHPGAGGGWRDGPRHFRSRGGSGGPSMHYRGSRGFGSQNVPRYSQPGPRFPVPAYSGRPGPGPGPGPIFADNSTHQGRGRYGNRSIFPRLQQMRQSQIPEHVNSYPDKPFYNEDPNAMEDRKQAATYGWPSPWADSKMFYENQNRNFDDEPKSAPHRNTTGYAGHRPPASDHYGSNPAAANENSHTFSRSVDDTVDIIRRRLINRGETQNPTDIESNTVHESASKTQHELSKSESAARQLAIARKKLQRPRNVKANCDQIKNKIVHQLFKMDKDRIHKLMDNPNSSSKFEYALSSLINESQNSYNRHLRSMAEKSLCSSSTDFINNDDNTIYEDTFMKQMQCILDPQDTVLLEDLKPLVLAELSKVLQLSNFEQDQSFEEQAAVYPAKEQSYHGDDIPIPDTLCNEYPHNAFIPADNKSQLPTSSNQDLESRDRKPLISRRPIWTSPDSSHVKGMKHGSNKSSQEDLYTSKAPSSDVGRKMLWTRRTSSHEETVFGNKISNPEERNKGIKSPIPEDGFIKHKDNKSPVPEDRFVDSKALLPENRHMANKTPIPEDRCMGKSPILEDKSLESNSPLPGNIFMGCKSPISEDRFGENTSLALPIFDQAVGDLSDDEAFAELDRQYHVAVDRNFIANYGLTSPPDFTQGLSKSPTPLVSPAKPKSPERPQKPVTIKPPAKPAQALDSDINSQLLDLAKSPLKLVNPLKLMDFEQTPISEDKLKVEISRSPDSLSDQTLENTLYTSEKGNLTENVALKSETVKTENILAQNPNQVIDKANPRKRSTDQKPSHRKEKRKKVELPPEPNNKQILNKNIIINVNDCAGKTSEKCDAPKSIFNLFFSKEKTAKDAPKDVKKTESLDKGHDKHVKRKDIKDRDLSKKSREKESDDQKKQNSNTTSQSTQSSPALGTNIPTPIKEENKAKLTTIDMFENCHKKPTVIDNVKLGIGRKITKRHVGTQVVRKICSKETQTPVSKSCNCKDKKRPVTLSVQTDPVLFKTASKTADPFERMKDIDIEIQVLLQEKFMLYSSMESKEACPNSMPLGMTVLNVEGKIDDVPDLEDAIVDQFANIPVEELEKIAFETVNTIPMSTDKNKRQKSEPQPARSPSPIKSPVSTRNKKKSLTPNISLIEQIITDDRPLEDIISLDELELKPTKKKKSKKSQPKKVQFGMSSKVQSSKKGSILKRLVQAVEFGIKDCCVVLKREDLTKYMTKEQRQKTAKNKLAKKKKAEDKNAGKDKISEKPLEQAQESAMIDEALGNDIQFDMLDVSEDIVIGESCEVKSSEEKISTLSTICEDIIFDNSQSSIEDAEVPIGAMVESECKLFDFSADDGLKRDSITVTGNADAVLAIECIDNNFIAACLDGNVYYFSGDGQLLNTLRGSNLAVTCLCIVREAHGITVYTGSLDSRIRYYDLETGLEKGPEGNVLSPIQTMDRAWDTIFVGTRTGFVLQFECKNNMLIPVSTVKFSDQSILALRAMKEGPRKVLLVAARSEAVTIKDAQSGLLLRTLEGPKMTVYTLLFEDGKVYCGTSNHQIHVFDYVSGSHVGVHEGGKGAVCLRAAGGLVFAGCYDGCVYVYREGQPRPLAQLRGPGLMLLSLAVIGSRIIAGYKDRSLYMWKMPDAILNEMIL